MGELEYFRYLLTLSKSSKSSLSASRQQEVFAWVNSRSLPCGGWGGMFVYVWKGERTLRDCDLQFQWEWSAASARKVGKFYLRCSKGRETLNQTKLNLKKKKKGGKQKRKKGKSMSEEHTEKSVLGGKIEMHWVQMRLKLIVIEKYSMCIKSLCSNVLIL